MAGRSELFRLMAGYDYAWVSEGAANNPGATTVLATTGALASVAEYIAYVYISQDTAAAINVQWRNAADDGNVEEQRVYGAANSDRELIVFFKTTAANQRLRIVPNASITGNACASIWYRKIA